MRGRSSFESNSASGGGALAAGEGSKVHVAGIVHFRNNTSSGSGGAIYCMDSHLRTKSGEADLQSYIP